MYTCIVCGAGEFSSSYYLRGCFFYCYGLYPYNYIDYVFTACMWTLFGVPQRTKTAIIGSRATIQDSGSAANTILLMLMVSIVVGATARPICHLRLESRKGFSNWIYIYRIISQFIPKRYQRIEKMGIDCSSSRNLL